ncbi:MAG: hypothetical protein RL557_291 [archaeon]|jgi:sugar-specific transcriptional regulator TrmB
MKEIESSLYSLGLSQVETSTYITLLANPRISVTKIAKLTHFYRPNIYQALERLMMKGLIYEAKGKRAKLFEAFPPEYLLKEFNKKKSMLEKVIPMLKKMQSESMVIGEMRVIEGINGWKNLLDEFIESENERVVFGVPQQAIEIMEGFFNEYHKKRAQKKLWLRHLFNYDARERIKITNKLPYTESKYLPKNLDQPVSTSVCGSLVAITVYNKRNILTIVIENKMIATAYKHYFDLLWKTAKN